MNEPVKGFRLSDRIVSALDRFIGSLARFLLAGNPVIAGNPGVMARFLFIYPFVGSTDWTHSLNLADYRGPNNPLNFTRFTITWSSPITHNELGIQGSGLGNTNCQMADAGGIRAGMEGVGGSAWNRKSWGFYSRSNIVSTGSDMVAAFTEPRNGYTYYTQIHGRYTDGNIYSRNIMHSHPSDPAASSPPRSANFSVAMPHTLGMIMSNQRGTVLSPHHWIGLGTTYLGGDDGNEIGMGYGDGTQNVPWYIYPFRNLALVFSTKHPYPFNGKDPTTGVDFHSTAGGTWDHFAIFVQQLQVALARAV
jgi:hypothetical protein